jgi:hypothetical protein
MYPAAKSERFSHLMYMILSPVSAMHAANTLTKDLYARFDSFAIAAVLLPSNMFLRLARKECYLVDERIRRCDQADLKEFHTLRRNAVVSAIEQAGLDIREILSAPAKADESATRYCPLCLAEYTSSSHECYDCGTKLEAYR